MARKKIDLLASGTYKAIIMSLAVAGLMVSTGHLARAADFETDIPGLNLNWNTTVRYSNDWRVEGQNPILTSSENQDDGDRNFKTGLVSNRVDVLSEVDLTYGNLGVRVSGEGWYDTVYNQRNANNSGGIYGPGTNSVNTYDALNGVYNQFSTNTRALDGRDIRLLDALANYQYSVAGRPGVFRIGQFALDWGQSLFLGSNAIAGAMNPVDLIKAGEIPGSQFKEIFLPVPQVYTQLQVTSAITVAAYYQFAYVHDTFPGNGSYLDNGDTGPNTPAFSYVGPPGSPVAPTVVQDGGHDFQGGAQVTLNALNSTFDVFAIKFDDKAFQVVPVLSQNKIVTPGGTFIVPGAPSKFYFAFPQGITSYGGDFTHTFGTVNVAGELSYRHNMDLSSPDSVDLSQVYGGPSSNNTNHPAYALGNTMEWNINAIWSVPDTPLWSSAGLAAEIAGNHLLACTMNCSALAQNASDTAWELAVEFSPTYYEVLPQLDVSLPIGLFYTPKGNKSVVFGPGSTQPQGGGFMTFGISGAYAEKWNFTLGYQHFFGPVNTFTYTNAQGTNTFSYDQTLADRDNISFSLSRTF